MIYKLLKKWFSSYDPKNVALLLCESFILKHTHKYVINKNFKTFYKSIK
jgi:hypothetical protein